ncbi:ATP-binding protein [Aquincola tertiaricarbonis]|uniref:ATP-binding protein n=1 Tax=Aquincola tertiaricarbonis TaxID=391953 RepID=A0ABY4S7U4_AQUTE|nr:ATP-binding protein [Aquincola tertiaricarbonis]URI08280.1 ATP-binding protein [Aquincola tertiaricarbonis]
MQVSKNELLAVLAQFNPWWRGEAIADLPGWRRAAFRELSSWMTQPPAPRAVLLSGARQIGKTTLLLQAADALLRQGVPAANILYATFDHPIVKLAGIDAVISAWREREPRVDGPEYLLLDEAQFIREWGTWVKHQVDFRKDRRIAFTGSAMPLVEAGQESGVGRWHTIRLTTLSFYEYLQIKQLQLPALPRLRSLRDLMGWSASDFYRVTDLAVPYVGHFHEYLVRGGFPQTAQVDSITQAQRLLREDIIDKVLKRDMTALFGVRRVLDLEHTFLYLCMHDGGLLDMVDLCGNLEVKRPTAQSFIELLQATHLIYRLAPFGYGKDVLRARFKIYLADAAIAPAVMLKGKAILEDPAALGVATETAVFKHLFARYYAQNVRFSYWRGKRDHEVDLVAEVGSELIPFEVKYRAQHTGTRELKGLVELCRSRQIERGYVVTKSLTDFGPMEGLDTAAQVMRVPAPLLCYWMGASEVPGDDD